MPRLLPLTALFLLGCSTAPAPPPALPPALAARARYLPGEALPASGSLPATASQPAAGAPWTVALEACWLDRMPRCALLPLQTRTRMIGTTAAIDPVQTHTEIAGRGRVGGGDAVAQLLGELALGRLANMGPRFQLRAVARPGMRTRLEVLDLSGAAPRPAGIACELEPTPTGAELLLEFSQDVTAAADEDVSTEAEPAARVLDRPRVAQLARLRLLDPLPLGTGDLLLLLPAHASGLVCALRLMAHAEAPDPEALAAAEADLRAAGILARLQVEPLSADREAVLKFDNAVQALAEGHLQRAALVFLSQVRPTPIASDLALVADPLLLLEWAAAVQAELDPHPRNSVPALAWTIERTALEALLRLIAQEALTPPLRGVLLRNVGELGNAPDLLTAAVAECHDVEGFQRRITEENLGFLVDTRPAARARASDWLLARGKLPPGFDPLGSPASRRAALEAWETAEAGR